MSKKNENKIKMNFHNYNDELLFLGKDEKYDFYVFENKKFVIRYGNMPYDYISIYIDVLPFILRKETFSSAPERLQDLIKCYEYYLRHKYSFTIKYDNIEEINDFCFYKNKEYNRNLTIKFECYSISPYELRESKIVNIYANEDKKYLGCNDIGTYLKKYRLGKPAEEANNTEKIYYEYAIYKENGELYYDMPYGLLVD